MAQAYCFKCRRKVEMQNAKPVILKNKRPAIRGVCSNCGTRVSRMGRA